MMLKDNLPDGQTSRADQCPTDDPPIRPLRLVYLAFDLNDSRVMHRARTLRALGLDLLVAGFHRNKMPDLTGGDWEVLDLGETVDKDYKQRLISMVGGAFTLWRNRNLLRDADGLIGRNIEQLLLTRVIRWIVGKPTPLAYECLDIHGMMIGTGVVARTVRAVERWCLDSCKILVVSSTAFMDEYFLPIQSYQGDWQLIENKFSPDFATMPRPAARRARGGQPLRIGWFGMLRCSKSFDLLMQIADARPNDVEIVIHGVPTVLDKADFESRINERANVRYGGSYKNPEDLPRIYDDIDLTWMIDFFEEGHCSDWLLPNRLYESGFYGVPMLTRIGTATAAYTQRLNMGWAVPDPLVPSVVDFVDALTAAEYERTADSVAQLPTATWVEDTEAAELVKNLTGHSLACR